MLRLSKAKHIRMSQAAAGPGWQGAGRGGGGSQLCDVWKQDFVFLLSGVEFLLFVLFFIGVLFPNR